MIGRVRLSNRAVVVAGLLALAVGLVASHWSAAPPALPRGVRPGRAGSSRVPGAARFLCRVRGQVVDGQERALAGVSVQLARWSARGTGGVPHAVVTHPTGRFVVPVARPGTYRMVLEAPGRARQVRQVEVLASGDQELGVLRLAPAQPIHGRVTDAKGRPLADVVMTAVSALAPPGRSLEPPHLAVTDAGGRFQLKGVPAGVFRVRASLSGYAVSVHREVKAPALDERFTLRPLREVWGRVLRRGKPVPGAAVSLVGSGAWPPRRVLTDEKGHFRFRRLRQGIYELRARHGTWVSRPSPPVDVLGSGEPPTVVLHLLEGVILSGRVVDAQSKRGLPGARLIASEQALAFNPHSTTTDRLGGFQLGPLLPGEYLVTVEQEGYLPRRAVAVTVLPAENPPLVLRLQRGAVLSGQVIDDVGRPVAGARLELVGRAVGSYIADRGLEVVVTQEALWNQLLRSLSQTPALDGEPVQVAGSLGVMPGPIPLVPGADQLGDLTGAAGPAPAAGLATGFVTDDKGRFRIRGVPPGTLALVVRHEDFVRHRTPPVRLRRGAPGREDLLIRLHPGVALQGEVLDAQRAGVSGAEVALSSPEDAFHFVVRNTDAAGRFRIPHLDGRLRLEVRAPGFVTRVVRLRIGSEDAPRKRVTFTLDRATCELSGELQDRRKLPVVGAQVTLESLTPDAPARHAVRSDARGAFHLTGLGRLRFQVTVQHADHPEHRFELRCPAPPPRWTLSYGGGLAFEVRDGQTGTPVPTFRFQLRRRGVAPVTRAGSAGRAEVLPLRAGRYELAVRAPGYARLTREVRVPASAQPRQVTRRGLVVRLQRAGSVAGWVRDRHGLAVGGVRVRIAEREGTTDARGRFLIGDVPVGTHTLEASHPDHGSGSRAGVTVKAGLKTSGLVVDLEPGREAPRALVAAVAIRVGERGNRLVIQAVTAGSAAERAGVAVGDELVRVDGQDLDGLGPGDVKRLLRGATGTPVVLELRRGGQTLRRVVHRELQK